MDKFPENYKELIKKEADLYFKDINSKSSTTSIAAEMSSFEFHLSQKDLVENFYDDQTTHSKPISLSDEWIFDSEPLAIGVARIYGVYLVKLLHIDKRKYSFSFIGDRCDVYACYICFKKLLKLAKQVKKDYKASLKNTLKPKIIKSKVEDYLFDWIEEVSSGLGSNAIIGDNYTRHNEYISNNFVAEKDYTECRNGLFNFGQVLLSVNATSTTNQEAMDKYEQKYGHPIKEIVDKFKVMQPVPVVVKSNYFN